LADQGADVVKVEALRAIPTATIRVSKPSTATTDRS
jgi:hypothetical protein